MDNEPGAGNIAVRHGPKVTWSAVGPLQANPIHSIIGGQARSITRHNRMIIYISTLWVQ